MLYQEFQYHVSLHEQELWMKHVLPHSPRMRAILEYQCVSVSFVFAVVYAILMTGSFASSLCGSHVLRQLPIAYYS